MLSDNLLENRLNAVKTGQPIPKPSTPQLIMSPQNQKIPSKNIILNRIIFTIDILLASFLYGFAINTIFSLDWGILGSLAVGFLLNHAITIFPKILFPKYFKQ